MKNDETETTLSNKSVQDVDMRNGRLAKLHRVLLMMLKDYAVLCERYNLHWCVAYGTAIGALRHQGFIPWDDDIDIYMPRKDLEKLTQIVQTCGLGRYSIVNSQTDAKYPLATTRFMLNDTEFRDASLQTADFTSCIFLDIFPLDNLADDKKLFRKQLWRAWLYNKLLIVKNIRKPHIVEKGFRALILRAGVAVARGVFMLPGLRAIDFNSLYLCELMRYNDTETKRFGYVCDTNRFSNIYTWDDLFPVRNVPFEDTMVPIARCAEKLLKEMYGDFMTPPLLISVMTIIRIFSI